MLPFGIPNSFKKLSWLWVDVPPFQFTYHVIPPIYKETVIYLSENEY